MNTIRQIMKLYSQRMGKKKIGGRLSISKNTVKLYIDAYHRLQRPWEELSLLTDYELNKIFNPVQEVIASNKLQQVYDFFPIMEKQLRKRGMTIAIQYRRFLEEHPDTYKESRFYFYYRQYRKKSKSSMHIEHKPGDKAYVDFAGVKLPYVDTETGEIKQAEIFVAILGWSQFVYVEAMQDQTSEEFILACENALIYFNGVPSALVPDNLKAAVIKTDKYEPELNANFKSFANHYGFTVLPARSRKPQDKAHVENMVKIVYKDIYTRIYETGILPLPLLNEQIRIYLTDLNNGLLTGKNYSRTEQWTFEKTTLDPLNTSRYEMRKMIQVTVAKNGHVRLAEDQHYYSAPFELIGKKLRLQYSRSLVEIFQQYELIATHKRVLNPHRYTTDPKHLSPEHRYLTEWNPTFFLDQARAIDPIVEKYIEQVLAKRQHPEQSYKSCSGILSFAKRVGPARLINACRRAIEVGYYNYGIIDDILKNNMDDYTDEPGPDNMPQHENIRGGDYYQ
ncbi:MAG: IS21 family transposase [Chitinophagales bacterium]|nr:IS21 family transposase [Chitinophagales bacterium]MBP9220438.1 IS21 family transposase [Chitinophagales bacterium]MBP9796304.1 IS21 family transposase [Chitinophagales bacterium]